MTDLDLSSKRVLIRQDLNVPIKDGEVTSDKRIQASLPTIVYAINAGAKVIITSHLGRPTAGEYEEKFSLEPVANYLTNLLGQEVKLVTDWLSGIDLEDGEVVLCENVRFNEGEKENDDELSKKWPPCVIFVYKTLLELRTELMLQHMVWQNMHLLHVQGHY
jgi:phosphoglycerate kinase